MAKDKTLKQSETLTILRSAIAFNPINPKRHPSEAVALQKKNLKRVGFLGGVVWNKATGNLVDGHRRVLALDSIHGYDGTPETDYEIKVEAADLSPEEERRQLTYMAVADTKPDLDLVAAYIREIPEADYQDLGFSPSELTEVLAFADAASAPFDIEELPIFPQEEPAPAPEPPKEDGPFETPQEEQAARPQPQGGSFYYSATDDEDSEDQPFEAQGEEAPDIQELDARARKEAVLQARERTREIAQQRAADQDAWITLSFSTNDALQAFMDLAGLRPGEKYCKGEEILALIS